MSDFDPQDVIAPVSSVPTKTKKIAPASDFDSADVIQVQSSGPSTASDFDPRDVVQVHSPAQGPTESGGWFSGKDITDEDLKKIEAKTGAPVSFLRNMAPYYGRPLESEGYNLKTAAGIASEAAGGIPTFIAKKMQSDPKLRAGMDELNSLAREKKSYAQAGLEMLAPLPGSTVARMAIAGAAMGLGESREGEEIFSTVLGGAAAGTLGLGARGAGKLISKYRLSNAERALLAGKGTAEEIAHARVDLNKEIQTIADKTAPSESIIKEKGLTDISRITAEEADTIVKAEVSPERYAELSRAATPEGTASYNRELLGSSAWDSNTPASVAQTIFTKEGTSPLLKEAQDIVETRARNFAEELTGSKPDTYKAAVGAIKKAGEGPEGAQHIAERYSDFVNLENAKKAISEKSLRLLDETGVAGKVVNWFSDAQFTLKAIDERAGSDLQNIHRSLNAALTRLSFPLVALRGKQAEIFNMARKAGLDKDLLTGGRVYDMLDKGIAPTSEAEARVVDTAKEYLSNFRDFINGQSKIVLKKGKEVGLDVTPMAMPRIEGGNYIPHMTLPTAELIPVVENKMTQGIAELEKTLNRPIRSLRDLTDKEFYSAAKGGPVKDLVDTVTLFDNKPVNTATELDNRLEMLLHSKSGNIRMETEANAALQRAGTIPEFMLDKNVYRVIRKYTDNTLKHLYLRGDINKLNYQSTMLKKIGAESEAKYVDTLVQDLLGIRKNTAAALSMQTRIAYHGALDKAISKAGKDSFVGGGLIAAKAAPELISAAVSNIYPNMLGYMNARAAIQNLTQGLTRTVPELGGTYGYTTVGEASLRTATKLKKLTGEAEKLGISQAGWSREGEQAVAEGIRRTAPYKLSSDAIAGMAKYGMIMFSKAEQFNRALMVETGNIMARDLAAGHAGALASVKKFPTSFRRVLEPHLGNPEVSGPMISKYLNDVTMFNYNRASMSEYGRTMGPIFSAFSKWPTAVAGELLQEMRTKGAIKGMSRGMERLFIPWALLQTFDYAVLGKQDAATDKVGLKNKGLSDVQKKVFGSGGLAQSAPAGSLGAIVKGEAFSPPVVSTVMDIARPIMAGKPHNSARALSTAATNFAPTAGLFRMVLDDFVTYSSGRRPEGHTQVERNLEGKRILNK